MTILKKVALAAISLVAWASFANAAAPASNAADEAAIQAVSAAWYKAFSHGDVEGVVTCYADDAVVSIPGMPMARGRDAIRAAYKKDIAAQSGATSAGTPVGKLLISGDLAVETATYTATDKSGAKVDSGKVLTIYQKHDGKWLMIRDIWNSDKA